MNIHTPVAPGSTVPRTVARRTRRIGDQRARIDARIARIARRR